MTNGILHSTGTSQHDGLRHGKTAAATFKNSKTNRYSMFLNNQPIFTVTVFYAGYPKISLGKPSGIIRAKFYSDEMPFQSVCIEQN